ncbi:MAG: hypothetical protein WC712_13610 [Candidatus Brocadiia bacterium]
MIRSNRCALVLLIFALSGIVGATASAEQAASARWHFAGWKWRTAFNFIGIPTPALKELGDGKLYARMDVRMRGLERKDLADIRVVDIAGLPIRAWVAKTAREGVRAIYCRPGDAALIYVYWGNATAETPQEGVVVGQPDMLGGLDYVITMCLPTPLNSAEGYKSLVGRAKPLEEGRVNDMNFRGTGRNLGEGYFAALFTGWIYTPCAGEYFIGTDSQGPSFIQIDGKTVASWPGPHWKQGTFTNGGFARLSRGIHSFRYINQRIPGGILAMAGWMPPGYTDSFLIPPEAFVRFAPLRPEITQSEPGDAVSDFEIVTQADISLNGGPPMGHRTLVAFGPDKERARWEQTRVGDKTGEGFSFVVSGQEAEFFFPSDNEWQISLVAGAADPVFTPFTYAKSGMVLPLSLDFNLDCLPSAVFRGLPFSFVMTVPNEIRFDPFLDFTVSCESSGRPIRTDPIRRRLNDVKHVAIDVTVDPHYSDIFALPGLPFTSEFVRYPSDALYDCTMSIRCSANGFPIGSHSFSFLDADAPLPVGLAVEPRSGLLTANGRKVVLVSEVERSEDFRRWEIIRILSSFTSHPSSFLLAGDGYSPDDAVLLQKTADRLVQAGKKAFVCCGDEKGAHFLYSCSPALLAEIDSGKYDAIVLSAGFEDAFRRIAPVTLETYMHALADRARARGIKKIFLLLPPLVPGYEKVAASYRAAFFDLARRLRLTAVDLDPMMTGAFALPSGVFSMYPSSEALDSAADLLEERLSN